MFHVILPSIMCANHLYCVTLDHAFMVGSTLYRQEMILFDSMICMHPWHLIIIELFGDSLWRCRFLGGASCGSSPHLRCFDVFRDTRSLEVRKFTMYVGSVLPEGTGPMAPWHKRKLWPNIEPFHDVSWWLSYVVMMLVACCFNMFQRFTVLLLFQQFPDDYDDSCWATAQQVWADWWSSWRLWVKIKTIPSWTSDQFPTQCPKYIRCSPRHNLQTYRRGRWHFDPWPFTSKFLFSSFQPLDHLRRQTCMSLPTANSHAAFITNHFFAMAYWAAHKFPRSNWGQLIYHQNISWVLIPFLT